MSLIAGSKLKPTLDRRPVQAAQALEHGLDVVLRVRGLAVLDVVALAVLPVPGHELVDRRPIAASPDQLALPALAAPLGDQGLVGLEALLAAVLAEVQITPAQADAGLAGGLVEAVLGGVGSPARGPAWRLASKPVVLPVLVGFQAALS